MYVFGRCGWGRGNHGRITACIGQKLRKPVELVITCDLTRYMESLCICPHTYDPYLLSNELVFLYHKN